MASNYSRSSSQYSHPVAKTATAAIVAGSFMVLYGLTNAATVMALVLATPPMVICSPVLILAVISMLFITAGFLVSAATATAALFLFYWIYVGVYLADKHHSIPMGFLDRLYGLWNKISGQSLSKHRGH